MVEGKDGVLLCTLTVKKGQDSEALRPAPQAEAIIANPVCYGHVHCAEKLRVPIHMLFTMPWTPTGAFPHPMARARTSLHELNTALPVWEQCSAACAGCPNGRCVSNAHAG